MRTEPDVERLAWGVVAFGFLEAVTVLTLLFSAHFRDRWFLLVFVVPAVAAVVVWGGRRLRRPGAAGAEPPAVGPRRLHAARGRHVPGD